MTLNVANIALNTAPTFVSTFIKHASGSAKRQRRRARRNQKLAEAAPSTTDAGADVDASANAGAGQAVSALAEVTEWPDENLLYDEGLQIVKRFLATAKNHTVEDLQAFTAMHIPSPSWVHVAHATVPAESVGLAADLLRKHFADVYGGAEGVGGGQWWTLRGRELEGEWIEMKRDYLARTVDKARIAVGEEEQPYRQDEKVILYIHGGAFFFSSQDTHRYQIQKHARKLGGRAFVPAYRLAPQYPFPCGLQDALASYLYLVSPPAQSTQAPIAPANILISGDSAGAGLVLSLLCVIRDSGGQVPMPAGATLISPWVDLTHSFASIMKDDSKDYIPSEGFHYKPSTAWPPIPDDDEPLPIEVEHPETGKVETRLLREQVQMYASNQMLDHPLVSPINQGSLGGLCPLMVMGGSGELLRDEMTFLAEKAANPAKYPPSEKVLQRYPAQRDMIGKFPPTKVVLEMHDGAAHVAPTLAWTRSARAMYRSAANFGLWALTAAGIADDQAHERCLKRKHRTPKSSGTTSVASSAGALYGTTVMTEDGDTIAVPISDAIHQLANAVDHGEAQDYGSEASSASGSDSDDSDFEPAADADVVAATGTIPRFENSMVRRRVSVRGVVRPMEPVEQSATFIGLDLQAVGSVHGSGPILKWLDAREKHDAKFAKDLAHFRGLKLADRKQAVEAGFLTRTLHGERPPLASLAGWYSEELATKASESVDAVGTRSQSSKAASSAMSLWMRMSEKDEEKHTKKPAQEAKVERMRQALDDLGINRADQDTLGDKTMTAVRDELEEQGVDVVREPVPEVGSAGQDLDAVGERLDADDSVPTSATRKDGAQRTHDDVQSGTITQAPAVKDVVLGKAV